VFRTSLSALFLVTLVASAQDPPKKRPITHADYEIWGSVSGVTLSPNGQYVTYTQNVPNADGTLYVKNVSTGSEYKVPVGSRGNPAGGSGGGVSGGTVSESAEDQFPTGGFGGRGAAGGGGVTGSPTFTPDSKFLYFPLTPTKAATDKAREEKKDTPKTVLAVMDLSNGQIVQRIEGVRSFSIVGDGAGVLITVKEPKPEITPTTPTAPKTEAKPEEKKDQTPQPSSLPGKEAGGVGLDQRGGGGVRQPGGGGGQGSPGGTGAGPGARQTFGNELGVKNLADGKEVTFTDVQTYSVTRDTKNILYTVNAKQTEKNGVYFAGLFTPESAVALKTGIGRYYTTTWNADQTKLAFYFDEKPTAPAAPPPVDPTNPQPAPPPDPDALSRKPRVYLWERPAPTRLAATKAPMAAGLSPMVVVAEANKVNPAVEVLGPNTPGLKKGWQIVDRGGLSFTADGKKLVVSAAPTPEPAPAPLAPPGRGAGGEGAGQPAATATPSGTPSPPAPLPGGARGPTAQSFELNLWHWKDEAIQPMQKVRANTDRTRSYRCIYFLDTKEFKHIADEDRSVNVPAHGDWGIGSSDKNYRGQTWRSPNPSDYALVNIRTGDSKPLLKEHGSAVFASPKNKAIAWFDGKDWFAATVPDGKPVNLTAKLSVKFFDEEFDQPMTPRSYGQVGWSSDDQYLFVSDRFDIWRLSVDGKEAKNVTEIGRGLGIRLRLVRVEQPDDGKEEEPSAEPTPGLPPGTTLPGRSGADRADRGLDTSKPWLLRAENLTTRDTGFYRMMPGAKPQLLVMGARNYGTPTKAAKGDTQILTIQTFKDYPDYYVTGSDFREIKRITDGNPRAREFNWGVAELMHFKNTDGVPLQAILIKPEDFDPSKKYPMMVYIYERLSQNLHTFTTPRAGTSINPTYYASNGYLVLMPDIAYTVGTPGQSALKCVLPAIQAVADKGYLNEQAIGIQGHSWGGYQIAYMITQTNRFKAASAGAPVSNMTSAYGGIRWGTGLARQFQYEHTQSRIGATLWQAPMKYIENSPLFFADRVQTPLIMLHNDADDAVPWYQGIEYFLALRRLNKEVYLFNYNGQPHGLRNPAATRDYTMRMQQFFDHHLKGAPMPEWMAKGVPYLEREKEKQQWKKLFEPEKK
jgi:dienelactone hydrolase